MTLKYSTKPAPIGVFDSGFGGLSILREIRKELPQYDYIFLGDTATDHFNWFMNLRYRR